MNAVSMPKPKTVKHIATIEIDVPEEWISLLVSHSDVFRHNFCGYWAFGEDVEGGWLVLEHDDKRPTDEEIETARMAHERGDKLPPKWFVMDRDFAIRAYVEGFKRGGEDWYENGDQSVYDCAIQMAALGEVRYG